MVTESEIKDQIFRVLAHNRSLNDLQTWMAETAWNPALDSSPEVAELADEIELLLADFSSKCITRKQLLDKFRTIMNHVVANVVVSDAVIVRDFSRSSAASARSYQVSPLLLAV